MTVSTPYATLLMQEVTSAASWDATLLQLERTHPLQTWAWGSLKSRWGWSTRAFEWTLEGEPRAAALILKRTLPYSPFCVLYLPKGPLFDYRDASLRTAILRRLQQFARNERAIFIKIDPDVVQATGVEAEPSDTGEAWLQELTELGWCFSTDQIQFRNTVTFDLTQSEDEILGAMKAKTRYNIRLAERKGVTVRTGGVDDFEMVADMYAETGERNAFAIRPRAYYLDVWRTFAAANMLHILIAEYDAQPLAALLIVYHGPLALYMYGASSEQERNRMPTYLLQWEALRWAQSRGCTQYDMWGAPDHFVEEDRMWGVWRFKRGFNGTVTRHIGAWDFAVYPHLYQLYTEAMPRYLAWLRSR